MSGNPGNQLRFSKEEDEKLINAVSGNPALYDSKHKLFHDKSARNRTWEEIANTVGRSVIDCKLQWTSLKDVYRKRKRESIDSSNKKPKWEHLDSLKFLEDVVSTKVSSDNKKMTESAAIDYPDFVSVLSADGSKNDPDIKIEMDEDDLEGESSLEAIKTAEAIANNPNNQSAAVAVKSEDSDQNSEPSQAMKMFFDSMAQTVMSFPTGLVVRAKVDVLQAISKIEREMWNNQGRHKGVEFKN